MLRNLHTNKIRKLAADIMGPIPKRLLGKTGVSVTQLGLGAGGVLGRDTETDIALSVLADAIDLGINYIDTAPEYGPSEEYIGLVLPAVRNKIVLASKTQDRTRDGSMRLLEKSLKRLRTDYLDIWQIHHIDHSDEVKEIFATDGAIKALQEAKEQGMVRYVGITGHYDPKPLLSAIKRFDFDTILMAVNAADVHKQSFIKELLPEAKRQNLGIIGMKVCCLGRIFHSWGINSMKQALDYVLSLPVSTAIVGIDNHKQLHENVALAKEFKNLKPKEMDDLEDKTKNYHHLANFFRKGNEDYNPWWKAYPQKKKKD